MNLKTGQIEAEFHKYIKPTKSPRLGEHCIKLTGISQAQVDNGISLQTALNLFDNWLRKELSARNLTLPKMSNYNANVNCAFITWGNSDFGVFMHEECRRKGIKKPPLFNQWIDMQKIYGNLYRCESKVNLLDALTNLGLKFEGRKHSGIDDAKNLALLTYKMVCNGASLNLTNHLD